MLAYQLKRLEQKQSIISLKDCDMIITDQRAIDDTVRNYFTSLYKSEYKAGQQDPDNLFNNVPLPKLMEENGEKLVTSISEEEISNTVKSLSNGKAPGNDVYTAEFYKCFSKDIMRLLLCLYDDVVEDRVMRPTMSLLPKPGKDHLDVKNYRPISLFNNDYEVFAKLLVKRLEEVTSPLIHVDQVGFTPG